MADLRKLSKTELIDLAARQRIQIGILEAVRDSMREQIEAALAVAHGLGGNDGTIERTTA